jgi:hypothetical protein
MTSGMTLGRLSPVELRHAWVSEAQDFTPWLAQPDNLALLGETLDLELEVDTVEKPVGPYRADILCREAGTDRLVLIENQIEATDHRHLGQLLTYAAGLDTAVICWLARRFTEEHRAVLDWLNEITDDRFAFFGAEIELWKIGDSDPAPRFSIVAQPNEWRRAVAKGASRVRADEPEGIDINRVAYWAAFEQALEERQGPLKPRGRAPRAGAYSFTIASNMYLPARDVARREIGVYLGLYGPQSAERYQQLAADQTTIDAELCADDGHTRITPVEWQEKAVKNNYRVMQKLLGTDVTDELDWPRQHKWLIDRLERFNAVFRPRLMATGASKTGETA